MQATAIGTVAVTIVLLGLFLYARTSAAHLAGDVFSQITISAYLDQNVTPAQVSAVRTALAQDARVRSAIFVPKSEGLKELRAQMQGQIDTSILTENPLPDKFRITVNDPNQVPAVAAAVRKIPGVASVDYGAQVVTRLLQLAAIAHRAGLAILALFLLVAGIIISNTIRLTVFARRREISIMQLVGATGMYVRLPFICEGVLAGLLGSLLAVVLLIIMRLTLVPKISSALPWLQMNAASIDLSALVLQLIAAGVAVGALASWISVGRYLET